MNTSNRCFVIAAAAFSIFASGCATPPVVDKVKAGDESLTCEQLQDQYNEVQRVKLDAAKEKTVGRNVARAIFWPLIAGSVMNANKSIAAADDRMTQLASYMNPKACAVPEGPDTSPGATEREIFRGKIVAVEVVAATSRVMPVTTAGGGQVFIPVGSPESRILTVRAADGRIRTVRTFEKHESGSCISAVAAPEIPRGLKYFDSSDLTLKPEANCP